MFTATYDENLTDQEKQIVQTCFQQQNIDPRVLSGLYFYSNRQVELYGTFTHKEIQAISITLACLEKGKVK